ncbi:hypothetical protein [Texcoconibacillus texcoconensis]|uniref:Magnesium-transporting ATPase (P-type) n=1 Tax=Texcoconibacillus texcoconensis TaxID=1095777 RepID=A0A840QM97_9BACI|nr:hypothetical protein [Texcoconibacillus texcoconensis]MBB5172488.1 magnesium-transporting ATPase (P-type) [Texcoconibacillus texcoconensis]
MMNAPKWFRIVLLAATFLFLVIFPMRVEFAQPIFYYVGIVFIYSFLGYLILLGGDKRFDERFHEKWVVRRQQPRWKNTLRMGVRCAVIILAVVSFGQFAANGMTPVDIFNELSLGILTFLSFFIVAISWVAGYASWYENEKRYDRIDLQKQKQQHEKSH